MLTFQDITYHCPSNKKILDSVSWQLEAGMTTAVVGPNGAGKSTLLKILTGELKPTAGSVLLDKKSVSEWAAKELARMRSVLPQSFELTFDFTVHEVVKMGRMPHVQKEEQPLDLEICEEALKSVDMLSFKDRLYTTLSGGEKQRVHLARVLAQIWPDEQHSHKRYLFLDEPTSSLDLSQQHSTLKTVQELKHKDTGIFVVLHDLNLAMKYADEAILLSDGKIIAAGKVREVLNPENIQNVFNVQAKWVDNPFDDERPLIVTASCS